MTMAEKNFGDITKSEDGTAPPDVLPQVWTSWIDQLAALPRTEDDFGNAW